MSNAYTRFNNYQLLMLDISTTQPKRKKTPNEITHESDQVSNSSDITSVEFSLSQYPQAFSRTDQVL